MRISKERVLSTRLFGLTVLLSLISSISMQYRQGLVGNVVSALFGGSGNPGLVSSPYPHRRGEGGLVGGLLGSGNAVSNLLSGSSSHNMRTSPQHQHFAGYGGYDNQHVASYSQPGYPGSQAQQHGMSGEAGSVNVDVNIGKQLQQGVSGLLSSAPQFLGIPSFGTGQQQQEQQASYESVIGPQSQQASSYGIPSQTEYGFTDQGYITAERQQQKQAVLGGYGGVAGVQQQQQQRAGAVGMGGYGAYGGVGGVQQQQQAGFGSARGYGGVVQQQQQQQAAIETVGGYGGYGGLAGSQQQQQQQAQYGGRGRYYGRPLVPKSQHIPIEPIAYTPRGPAYYGQPVHPVYDIGGPSFVRSSTANQQQQQQQQQSSSFTHNTGPYGHSISVSEQQSHQQQEQQQSSEESAVSNSVPVPHPNAGSIGIPLAAHHSARKSSSSRSSSSSSSASNQEIAHGGYPINPLAYGASIGGIGGLGITAAQQQAAIRELRGVGGSVVTQQQQQQQQAVGGVSVRVGDVGIAQQQQQAAVGGLGGMGGAGITQQQQQQQTTIGGSGGKDAVGGVGAAQQQQQQQQAVIGGPGSIGSTQQQQQQAVIGGPGSIGSTQQQQQAATGAAGGSGPVSGAGVAQKQQQTGIGGTGVGAVDVAQQQQSTKGGADSAATVTQQQQQQAAQG